MLHKFDDNPLSRFGVVMVRTQMQNSNIREAGNQSTEYETLLNLNISKHKHTLVTNTANSYQTGNRRTDRKQ